MERIGHERQREKMIKFIFLGFMLVTLICLIYEIGYVHGFEDAKSMSHEKEERNEEKTN